MSATNDPLAEPDQTPIPDIHKMSPDQVRQAHIDRDPLAKLIHDNIEKLPAAMRLYPDLYAVEVANTIRLARISAPNRFKANALRLRSKRLPESR